MTDQQTAKIAVDLVKAKLNRAKMALIKFYLSQGQKILDPDIQYAVRVLDSRIREIERVYLRAYGMGPLRERAVAELNLGSRDLGHLITLGDKKHGVGRLDCYACDIMVSEEMPFPVPCCTICPSCERGVFHVYTIGEGTSHTPQVTGSEPSVPEAVKSSIQIHYTTVKVCDNCFYRLETPIDPNESDQTQINEEAV